MPRELQVQHLLSELKHLDEQAQLMSERLQWLCECDDDQVPV